MTKYQITGGTVELKILSSGAPTDMVKRYLAQGGYYGALHRKELSDPNKDFRLAATYYDSINGYQALAALTGLSFDTELAFSVTAYRDEYVLANNGGVPAYWAFSDGLLRHYQKTGDEKSKQAVILLSQMAAYAPDTTPLAQTADTKFSREVAYTINNYINAQALGEPHRSRGEELVSQARNHMYQWFLAGTAPYVRPFMVALTVKSLIASGSFDDSFLVDLDDLWKLYREDWGCFPYTDRKVDADTDEAPAPDLNMLLAPCYSYAFKLSGDSKWAERADKLFVGGTEKSYIAGVKQFNQQYFWGEKYLEWRT